MTNINDMAEFEPFFPEGKSILYPVTEASQRALCRALMELQCAYQMISDIDDAGMRPTERVAKAIQTAKEILSEVEQLSQEDSERVNNAKAIVEKLCGEDILRLTPDQAAIISMYVQQAWYCINASSEMEGKNCDNHDDSVSSDAELYHMKRCADELSLAADLLDTVRNSGSAPIVRLRCALRLAKEMLESVVDLNERDYRAVSEIVKFLSVLPDPMILIRDGKSKQLKKTLCKAGHFLTSCVQHVFDETTYDDTYHKVLFDFLDYPKSDEYKEEVRKELNKN